MSEIRKIKRKDLDLEKYSKTLSASLNYRVYAEYWYLDVVTKGNWECLVYGDYEVLMPIPFQRKFGFKFVLQPLCCQQLGVFYPKEISTELFQKFESKLHQYRVRSYHFNEENAAKFNPKGESKINQLLLLNRPYSEIYKGFKKGRKSDLSLAKKNSLMLKKEFSLSEIRTLFQLNDDKFISEKNIEKLINLLKIIQSNNKLIGYSIQNDQKETIAICLLLDSKSRLIHLFSIRNKSHKQSGEITFILNEIFQNHCLSREYFDFEGSSLAGVNEFNRSFGAEENFFSIYQNI
ncbi:hypothetical protein [Moheibacter stercoris]|uniref:Acetyltransferase (GNAT) domain-containing protein n=1 Tax=Moheibacter stercoris TaxID=1628251 RepID=A0ABV2LUY9_9FLAO